MCSSVGASVQTSSNYNLWPQNLCHSDWKSLNPGFENGLLSPWNLVFVFGIKLSLTVNPIIWLKGSLQSEASQFYIEIVGPR